MKRRDTVVITILVVLQLCCSSLWARPTTAYEAEMVVTGWLKADPQPLDTALAPEVMMVETFTDDYGQPAYFIVYLQEPAFAGTEPSGFVIVSANDLVEPIIGFVDDGIFDPSLDNPLGALVTNDLNGRMAAVRSTFSVLAMTPQAVVSETQKKWRRFISLGEARAGGFGLMGLTSISDSDVRVAPLVASKWGQSWYYDCDRRRQSLYNYYTPPLGPGDPNNYPTGCVATAMAQLMRYHQHPATGIGVHEFTIRVDDVEQTAYTRGGDGSGGPYQWSNMVLAHDCRTSKTQRKAIGALCYDAGVAVKMGYSTGASSASARAAAEALKTVFKYSHVVRGYNWDSVRKDFYNIGSGLNGMVNPNLDAGNPVILAIEREDGGHAVLCDGYYNLPTIDSDPPYNIITECIYNIFTSDSGEIISGRVINTVGNPMRNVVVTAQNGRHPYTAVTNSKGIYAIKSLGSDSTYTVTVTKPGYNFTPQDVTTEKSADGSVVSGNKWGIDFVGMEPWRYNSMEDFETGDLSKFLWKHAGNASWTTTSQEKHFGAYSAQAGIIENNESTSLQVTIDCASGNITFYRKVSSEPGSDNLQFYIDGVQKDKWSGTEDWAKVSFGVTAGARTFMWTYSKDGSEAGGDDTVWIDDIEFPVPITLKTAYHPHPSDGAVDVNPSVSLSWTAGSGAVTHDVYLDTDEAAVANATISSGQFKGNQSGTTYTPGLLALGTTYYWRVDEVEADGTTKHTGAVWSFTVTTPGR
ncbi:MAG: C10 family peptidase [Planctomycetota bacterium]|jgi:hypothetical protein